MLSFYLWTESDVIRGIGTLLLLIPCALISLATVFLSAREKLKDISKVAGILSSVVILMTGMWIWNYWNVFGTSYPTFWPPPQAAWYLSVAVVNLLVMLEVQVRMLWNWMKANPKFVVPCVLITGTALGVLGWWYMAPRLQRYGHQQAIIERMERRGIKVFGHWKDWWVNYITVGSTECGDEDLECMHLLPKLKKLDVSGTRITDKGLEYIEKITQLKDLDISQTRVTSYGIKRLREVLPNLRIQRRRNQ